MEGEYRSYATSNALASFDFGAVTDNHELDNLDSDQVLSMLPNSLPPLPAVLDIFEKTKWLDGSCKVIDMREHNPAPKIANVPPKSVTSNILEDMFNENSFAPIIGSGSRYIAFTMNLSRRLEAFKPCRRQSWYTRNSYAFHAK